MSPPISNGFIPDMDKHLIYDFGNLELKYKATELLNQFNENKTDFYHYKDNEIIDILNQKMNYSQIVDSNNDTLRVQVN